jgi:uncharacterized protein YoxC
MHFPDVTLAHTGVWLLAQVAPVAQQLAHLDTIVTKQAPIQPGWFEQLGQYLRAAMTLAILVLTVAVVPAAWNFRKSYQKISDLLDRVYADVNPITHHASRIAENIDYVTTALRADVQRASATLTDANERLQEAVRNAESRVRDFDALLAVVQDESEGAFVSTASTMKGVRTGMETLRDALQLTLRDVRRAALTTPSTAATRPRGEASIDDVDRDLAAVDVRRTPAAGSPLVPPSAEPAGPATFGTFDEIVDDEVEEPVFDDEFSDELSAEAEGLHEEEREYGERSQQAGRARPERPRVRPRRGDDV